jgi:hypothetical protein
VKEKLASVARAAKAYYTERIIGGEGKAALQKSEI